MGDSKHNKRRNICLAVIAGIVIIAAVVLILGLTVFKIKNPQTTVNSLSLKDFNFKLDIIGLHIHLNVSVAVGLTVKNPNIVGFKHSQSSAVLLYRGKTIGDVPIPAGKIKAHGTMPMNLTLTVTVDKLIADSDLYNEINNTGMWPLTYYTRIPGKVRILKLFNIHLVSISSCDFVINVKNRSIATTTCRYKAHL